MTEQTAIAKFKIGDVVSLNSYTQLSMTVQEVMGTSVTCVYFSTDGTLKSEKFHQNMLTSAKSGYSTGR